MLSWRRTAWLVRGHVRPLRLQLGESAPLLQAWQPLYRAHSGSGGSNSNSNDADSVRKKGEGDEYSKRASAFSVTKRSFSLPPPPPSTARVTDRTMTAVEGISDILREDTSEAAVNRGRSTKSPRTIQRLLAEMPPNFRVKSPEQLDMYIRRLSELPASAYRERLPWGAPAKTKSAGSSAGHEWFLKYVGPRMVLPFMSRLATDVLLSDDKRHVMVPQTFLAWLDSLCRAASERHFKVSDVAIDTLRAYLAAERTPNVLMLQRMIILLCEEKVYGWETRAEELLKEIHTRQWGTPRVYDQLFQMLAASETDTGMEAVNMLINIKKTLQGEDFEWTVGMHDAHIRCHIKNEQISDATKQFYAALEEGFEFTEQMYGAVLSGHVSQGDVASALKVRDRMTEAGLSLNKAAYEALAMGCFRSQNMEQMRILVDDVETNDRPASTDFFTYAARVAVRTHAPDASAFIRRLARTMRKRLQKPSSQLFSCLITALARERRVDDAWGVVLRAIPPSVLVPTAINAYACLHGSAGAIAALEAANSRSKPPAAMRSIVYSEEDQDLRDRVAELRRSIVAAYDVAEESVRDEKEQHAKTMAAALAAEEENKATGTTDVQLSRKERRMRKNANMLKYTDLSITRTRLREAVDIVLYWLALEYPLTLAANIHLVSSMPIMAIVLTNLDSSLPVGHPQERAVFEAINAHMKKQGQLVTKVKARMRFVVKCMERGLVDLMKDTIDDLSANRLLHKSQSLYMKKLLFDVYMEKDDFPNAMRVVMDVPIENIPDIIPFQLAADVLTRIVYSPMNLKQKLASFSHIHQSMSCHKNALSWLPATTKTFIERLFLKAAGIEVRNRDPNALNHKAADGGTDEMQEEGEEEEEEEVVVVVEDEGEKEEKEGGRNSRSSNLDSVVVSSVATADQMVFLCTALSEAGYPDVAMDVLSLRTPVRKAMTNGETMEAVNGVLMHLDATDPVHVYNALRCITAHQNRSYLPVVVHLEDVPIDALPMHMLYYVRMFNRRFIRTKGRPVNSLELAVKVAKSGQAGAEERLARVVHQLKNTTPRVSVNTRGEFTLVVQHKDMAEWLYSLNASDMFVSSYVSPALLTAVLDDDLITPEQRKRSLEEFIEDAHDKGVAINATGKGIKHLLSQFWWSCGGELAAKRQRKRKKDKLRMQRKRERESQEQQEEL